MIKPKTPHEKGETLHKNGVFSNAQVKPILSLFLPLENKAFFLKNTFLPENQVSSPLILFTFPSDNAYTFRKSERYIRE